MSNNDLLERRAQRGTTRGAANTWAAAQPQTAPASSGWRPDSRLWLRLALTLSVLIAGVVVLRALSSAGPTELDVADVSEQDRDRDVATDRDPVLAVDHILVDGMDLKLVSRPFDPYAKEFRAESINPSGYFGQTTGSQVFADPEDPFNNPIIGIDNLEGGGFRPWGANLGDTPLEEFTNQLSQENGAWILSADSGLVEVASFQDDLLDHLKFGWQFDFEQGSDTVTWQAEPHKGEGVWLWVARLLSPSEGAPTELRMTESPVVGQSAITIGGNGEYVSVVWVHDDLVYRVTAGELRGNTHYGRSAEDSLPLLHLVDDQEWQQAVSRAGRGSILSGVLVGLQVLLVLAWVLSGIYFLLTKEYRLLAGLAPLVVVIWVAFGPSGWLTVPLALSLLAAWYYAQKGRDFNQLHSR